MLPSRRLIERQADWLAPLRARILREVDIGRRARVLDLGAGYGTVTPELARRCAGLAFGLDRQLSALREAAVADTSLMCGDATALPFRDQSLDLVFTQFALLWMPLDAALREVHRVLRPGGVLVALEPDYGGMIEWPPAAETREIWLAGLRRAGADPYIGRKLPDALAQLGWRVTTRLTSEIPPADPERLTFLHELDLTAAERACLDQAQSATLAHLPLFCLIAER